MFIEGLVRGERARQQNARANAPAATTLHMELLSISCVEIYANDCAVSVCVHRTIRGDDAMAMMILCADARSTRITCGICPNLRLLMRAPMTNDRLAFGRDYHLVEHY